MNKIFVKTQNVKNFIGLVENLINKPKNIPKMGLVYGEPGLGKSQTALWLACKYDGIYLRASNLMTGRWLLFVLTVCMLLSWLIYDITPTGNILLIYLDAMLLALIMSGLGLIISNYSDQMMQAMLVMWFIMVCFILLSGLFTPVQSMPQWAQTLTLINPMRHFIDAMRTVFVRGGVFMSIWPQILTLAVFAIIINTWAVISYKKNS